MLSTIGFIAVVLIVFTIGFVLGRRPANPFNAIITIRPADFTEEDKEAALDILDQLYEALGGEVEYEDDEEESDSSDDIKEITVESVEDETSTDVVESSDNEEIVVEEDNKNE